MSLVFWMCLIISFCGPSTTTPSRKGTPSTIVTSAFSTSTKKVSSTPGLTSILLNGTSTTLAQTGTSANTSSTTSFSVSEAISSDKQPSTALTSTSFNGTDIDAEYPELLIIIMVVVLAVLVGSSILVIVFILHRRRYKKSSEEDASKNQLPSGLVNHSNTNLGVSNQNYKAAESSNYDEMNDESITTYSRPVKKKKDDNTIAIDKKTNGGNDAADEYDRIVFEDKYAVKISNYDSVSAKEVKKLDDTYSHVSNQSKPASAGAPNDYSHCQFIRTESGTNDYTKPFVADNYSHVDPDTDKRKRRPPNITEEDSYNHIQLDKTTNPPRNGHAANVRTILKSEEGSQRFKDDLQSLDVESEGWTRCDRNSGVSSQGPPIQDIKAVSLPDKYIEFKIGDIYDTPRCKDQEYNIVLNKEQLFSRIDTGSKGKSGTKDNNDVTDDYAIRSDYELAKTIDF